MDPMVLIATGFTVASLITVWRIAFVARKEREADRTVVLRRLRALIAEGR